MAITDSWLKAHYKKPHEKTTEKADGEGLSARVSPAGKIVFQMRYRYGGTPARLDLGVYPRMSLKEARTEHQRLKAELEQGHDPRVVRRVERVQISTAATNESLYRDWYENYCVTNKTNHKALLRSFELHVFPVLGSLPADKTSTHSWLSLIEDVADRSPAIAERLLYETKQLHKWANRRGLMVTEPLGNVSARVDLQTLREEAGRSLSDEEITVFWKAVDRSRMSPEFKIFLKLCLFFGCRNGELRLMDPTTDLDFEAMTWTIPAEKNKTRKRVRKGVVRPLIPEVLPLIKEAMSMSKSPRLLFTQFDAPKAMHRGTTLRLPGTVMLTAKKQMGIEMAHWSMHDLRKTARTNFSTLTEPHVAEMMLGHSLKGMQGVYDRHLYLEEQAAAYRAWWQRLEELRSRELR